MRLTDQQQAILDHRHGPLLVLAGAGSGKTTTVTRRAAALAGAGVCPPASHLMLTFARKAAKEMRHRFALFLGDEADGPLAVDTYHAFAYRLLRHKPALCQRRPGVTVLDEADQGRLIKGVCASLNIDYQIDKGMVRGWKSAYSLVKNHGLSAAVPEDRERTLQLLAAMPPTQAVAPRVYDFCVEYERRLRLTNTLDYDDLCLWAARAIASRASLAHALAARFPMVTVDEAQDTNAVQYAMVDGFARLHRNLTLVGDDDQSIYGWRGARIENMQRFIDDYSPVQARLEQNFRSTPAIVSAAARHIGHNAARLDKTPFAAGASGAPPALVCHDDGRAMAFAVADGIREALTGGTEPREIAILYRTNRMARVMEGALRARDIPYRVVGGHSLYDSIEAKAAIAGARLAVNPCDEQAFMTLLPHLPGLGAKGAEHLLSIVRGDASLANIIETGLLVAGPTQKAITWLDDRLYHMRAVGPTRAGAWVLEDAGLGLQRKWTQKAGDNEAKQGEMDRRLANLEALDAGTTVAMALRFPDYAGNPEAYREIPETERFAPLLEAKVSDMDDDADDPNEVTLSTVHRAKGLEWDVVHVAGYSDGLMPLEGPSDDSAPKTADLAEERRLSYVAITRARYACLLHHADRLRFPGDAQERVYLPSRFVEELGLDQSAAPTPQNVRRADFFAAMR